MFEFTEQHWRTARGFFGKKDENGEVPPFPTREEVLELRKACLRAQEEQEDESVEGKK